MKLNKTLDGDDVYLRSLIPEDSFDSYFRWFSDEEVMRYLEVRFNPPKSVLDLKNFVSSVNDSPNSMLAGIFLKSNHEHIGNIKIAINKNYETADFGYLIGVRSAWGKGYATQAIRIMVQYAFEDLSLFKLFAACSKGNEGSRKALIKAGFFQEGFLSLHLIIDGERRGVYMMSILKSFAQGENK